MKTVKDIQKEVLATVQVTLDELRASIEKVLGTGLEYISRGSEPVQVISMVYSQS